MTSVFDYPKTVWAIDFECHVPDGENPDPICLTAREYFTGASIQLWRDDLKRLKRAPFDTGPNSVVVGYSTITDLNCFLSLNWELPTNVWDPYVEYLRYINPRQGGKPGQKRERVDLNTALETFGIPAVDAEEKRAMRALAMANGPFDGESPRRMIRYCQEDTDRCLELLRRMDAESALDHVDRIGLRGRYMRSLARVRHYGIPIDVDFLQLFQANWAGILSEIFAQANRCMPVFDGEHLRHDWLADWAQENGVPWPRTITGLCSTNERILRDLASLHPAIGLFKQALTTRSQVRLGELPIGRDGRCRPWLNPFGQKGGRNNPPAREFIFSQPSWARGLIKPGPGMGICYLDFRAEEVAVAGAMSNDANMQSDYLAGGARGDVYLEAGKWLIPADAVKAGSEIKRSIVKSIFLGLNYWMSAAGFARRAGLEEARARAIFDRACARYATYRRWSREYLHAAKLCGFASTKYGWRRRTTPYDRNPRSIVNFAVQSTAAEILRSACYRCTEHGIRVLALVHDSLLVEGPESEIEEIARETERHMVEASAEVLDGFPIRVDRGTPVVYPQRFAEKREGAQAMWEKVVGYLHSVPANSRTVSDTAGPQS